MTDDEPARLLTIRQAAEAAGMTPKALRSRVDRGSIQSVKGRDGMRRIPRSELERAGLLLHDGPALPRPEAGAARGSPDAVAALAAVIERQAGELAELRAIAAQSDVRVDVERQAREAVERELHEARARVAELEARRRRWWQR